MNICVFCSCSPINENDAENITMLGRELADMGNDLVFGAFGEGMMGAVADGFATSGADIYGVAPKVLIDAGREVHPGCTRVIETISLAERKAAMIELSDAIIAAPGGIGTLDEVFSVLAMDITNELSTPVIFYNYKDFYNELYDMLEKMHASGFIRQDLDNLAIMANSIDEILEIIRSQTD